jgi:F-type H+/Na+-transporting ATPase subunit alpha
MRDFKYYLDTISEVGFVEEAKNPVVYVSGLPRIKPGEMVLFETGEKGMAMSFDQNLAEILIFSKKPVTHKTRVVRTNEVLKIPAGAELLGKIINPLGNPINPENEYKKPKDFTNVEIEPSNITYRRNITRQLETGIPMVDLVMPLGYGQKELVIGERKTGKTNFVLQTILTQTAQKQICIYAAIAKKKLDIKNVEEFLQKNKIQNKVVVVAASVDDPIALSYLAPYSAMAIAEYFKDQGSDVMIVLDDLTSHAKTYREMALISNRFPGRNSYPGDIFHAQAKLLERSGNFITPKGEKAITCLPVVETEQADLAGYIQTNIVSMSDGHLYFDSGLFAKGRRPAINPFLSVTRVGRQTQSPLIRTINREILSFLTIAQKMEEFSHFGAELSESSKITISIGEKVIKFLNQNPNTTMPINLQTILFAMLWNNILQNKNIDPIGQDINKVISVYKTNSGVKSEVDNAIQNSKSFNDLLRTVRTKGDTMINTLRGTNNN